MHIVQVTQSYPPSQGGVETHVKAISTRLADAGHRVTVVSADAGVGNQTEVREGVEIHRYRSISPNGAYHLAPQILAGIKRLDADVIHAHNYHALLLPFAAMATDDSKFVITPHYHGGSESKLRDILLNLYQPLGYRILNRADTIIAVSDWERGQIRCDFGLDAEVIQNGIDVARFSSAEPCEYDRPYLLCVGRLEKYKGVQHVIRAMAEIPEYDLIVAGSGPYMSDLQQIAAESGVADQVEFLGYVSDEQISKLYRSADVFVTLSSFESFGLTVGEALAAGTPCLILRRGALVDWEQYRGVIGIDTPQPRAIRGGIEQAQGVEPNQNQIPQWDDHVDKLIKLYTK